MTAVLARSCRGLRKTSGWLGAPAFTGLDDGRVEEGQKFYARACTGQSSEPKVTIAFFTWRW
jgi:hypothetical protein